jgi:hypothetical protein
MNRVFNSVKMVLLFTIVLVILLSGCKAQSSLTTSSTSILPATYSQYQLEYRLFAKYPNIFWCDSDYYPVAREGQEQQNSVDQFLTIKSNQAEFSAILTQLNLPNKTDYTDNEKLLIYREHKKLTYAVQMTAANGGYNFDLRVGEGQGTRIQGTIITSGEIQETSRETSFNTCPICLVKGTLIDTPQGRIPVEQLSKGMIVWTTDDSGNRIAKEIVETTSTIVPSSFKVIKIELNDGRTITASPGHPTAEGRAIADYQLGNELDGAQIVTMDYITYENSMTYDILPAGNTGYYWANGILLGSTLKKK